MVRRRRSLGLSGRATSAKVRFEEAKHRRDPAGKFADKPGAGDDAPRSVARAAGRGSTDSKLRAAGVSRSDQILVNIGGKQTPGATVDELLRHRLYKIDDIVKMKASGKIVSATAAVPASTRAAPSAASPLGKEPIYTTAERDALTRYQGVEEAGAETTTWSSLNASLRGQGGTPDPQLVRDLDSAIAKGSITQDIEVYRGFTADVPIDVGTTVTDRAYMSTSMLPNVAREFAPDGGRVVRLTLPRGTKAAYYEEFDGTPHREVLLGRGTEYRITRFDGTFYWAELV